MPRPEVDVVVPFAGEVAELLELTERMRSLEVAPHDTVTIVDNRRAGGPSPDLDGAHVQVLPAPEIRSSYFARNRGAAGGRGAWIVFIDADVEPPRDLLARYFAAEPGEGVAVLAGAVRDEPADDGGSATAASRYASLRNRMGQENTLRAGAWAYAQTANCAVRRAAFEQVGGFRDDVRSGGDADLCFRLRAAGWQLEPRPDAEVVHRSRRRLPAMLRQRARHGSGGAWLNREYPGSFPRKPWTGLSKYTLESCGHAVVHAVRGERDAALLAAIDPLEKWAFELGRLAPNEVRPDGRH